MTSSILNSPANQTKLPDNFRNHLLQLVRQQLSVMKVANPRTAKRICKLIPPCCPFEQDIQILGYTLFRIPALCKLNPFYNQLVELRFRALSYLADECGEDVTVYC